jgi:hypothetical protein
MWMSQSSWPSFMWQTYDWYLDTNGGYFGAKAGNQPTRAVWDPRDDSIILANMAAKMFHNVTTDITVYNLRGRLMSKKTVAAALLDADTCGLIVAKVDFSASDTDLVFLRLTVTGEDGAVLGENTYWHNRRAYQDYHLLNDLPSAAVEIKFAAVSSLKDGDTLYTLTLENTGTVPAVQVSLKAYDKTGNMLLPVFFSDNYLTLLPGDRKTVTAEVPVGQADVLKLGGWNIEERQIVCPA